MSSGIFGSYLYNLEDKKLNKLIPSNIKFSAKDLLFTFRVINDFFIRCGVVKERIVNEMDDYDGMGCAIQFIMRFYGHALDVVSVEPTNYKAFYKYLTFLNEDIVDIICSYIILAFN